MRFCSYVVVHDGGFAPNPFAGYCTLAACTPNHQGLRLKKGDWLLGHGSAETGNRLIYAMQVADVLDFDDYFHARQFAAKKPQHGGCGSGAATTSTSEMNLAGGHRVLPSTTPGYAISRRTRVTREYSSPTTSSTSARTRLIFLPSLLR